MRCCRGKGRGAHGAGAAVSLKRRGTKGANILLVYNVTISLQYASNEVLQGEREGSTWSGSSSEFEKERDERRKHFACV